MQYQIWLVALEDFHSNIVNGTHATHKQQDEFSEKFNKLKFESFLQNTLLRKRPKILSESEDDLIYL